MFFRNFLILFPSESPIQAHGGFCLQPESGGCRAADDTRLVYIRDTSQCSKVFMEFTYHNDVLTHKCSGKRVCPRGMLVLLSVEGVPPRLFFAVSGQLCAKIVTHCLTQNSPAKIRRRTETPSSLH